MNLVPIQYCLYFQKSWYGKKIISSNARKITIGNVYLSIFLKHLAFEKICLHVNSIGAKGLPIGAKGFPDRG